MIILEQLSCSEEPLGLPELAEKLDVDRSTIYRLMGTLLNRGYVVQDSESRKYSLGLKVIELSRKAVDGFQLRTVSKPFIMKLVAESGESTNLAVLSGDLAICIDHETSPSPLAVINEIGDLFVNHATSLGKVLMAFQPEEDREEFLKFNEFKPYTPNTIIDSSIFTEHMDQIRANYYATDNEERFLGIRCIAAPIFDYTNKVIAAIGISAPASRMLDNRLDPLIMLVKKTAFDISVQSGYPVEKVFPGLD